MGLRAFLGLKKPRRRRGARPRIVDTAPLARPRGRAEKNIYPQFLRGSEALERFIAEPDVVTVLDVGSGQGIHAGHMREAGKKVTCLSLIPPADVLIDYKDFDAPHPYDGIWASHVLEHQPNVDAFLRKCFSDLRPDGLLAITVPPLKHGIVGGHLSLWNAGLLVYRLVLAGFDCTSARVGTYGYNISVLVRRREAKLPDNLHFDEGDIEKVAQFFPVPVAQGFDGRLPDINW